MNFIKQELSYVKQNTQTIVPFRYKNYKPVKHLPENQKLKVQHQEKRKEKLLEMLRKTIKNKEPRKKVMILLDSIGKRFK